MKSRSLELLSNTNARIIHYAAQFENTKTVYRHSGFEVYINYAEIKFITGASISRFSPHILKPCRMVAMV